MCLDVFMSNTMVKTMYIALDHSRPVARLVYVPFRLVLQPCGRSDYMFCLK